MNSLKFAAAVLTAGIIATGAGVFAYQGPGKKQAAPRDRSADEKARPQAGRDHGEGQGRAARAGPRRREVGSGERNPSQTVASLAQARYNEAARILDFCEQRLQILIPASINREPLHSWALKVLEARRDLGDTKAKPDRRPRRTISR